MVGTRLGRGDRVVDPDDPTGTAVIVDGPQLVGGQRFYLVRNQAGEESYFGEADLSQREVSLDSPVAWLAQHSLTDPDHLARLATHLKLTSGLTDIIYSLSSTRTLFRVHQFKPVLKLIQSPSHRLLLADEVGLGKTIEAGLIWAEIDARTPTRRVLVICPSGLRTKWQTEMRRRFDRDMEIADRARVLELLDLYQERGDAAQFSVIASYNTLRHDDVLESLSNRPATLDLVIADEAHAMRNPETRTHQIGELLAQNSTSLLLLSATPVNLGSADLFQLLRLLHPEQYGDFGVFTRVLAPNEHINGALLELTRGAHPDGAKVAAILRRVENTVEASRFARNPIYELVLNQLECGNPLSPGDVNQLAQEISGLNTLSAAYNRTRKRDLTDHVAVRRALTLRADFTDLEEAIYAGAVALVAQLRSSQSGTGTGLATVMPARQAASCIPVMGEYLDDLVRSGRLETDFEEGEEDEEGIAPTESVEGSHESRVGARDLIRLCRQLHGVDTKLTHLTAYLRDLHREGTRQALLFSFFRRTLGYLHEQLAAAGFTCQVMNGATPLRDRDDLMRRFRAGEFDILLCSEIGSEGLDFEFCNVVINYDLPWNPMRVEQRIGRVDRFGQTSPVIHVVNFEVPGTIDTEIFLRLYRRIGVFESSIGELEPILGAQLQELNRVLARSELTLDEQTQLANRIALAVERQAQDLEQFEATRDRLIGADAYVSDSLEQAHRERRYITPDELERFVDGFLREEASPARISGDSPVLALTGSPALADHLRTYGRRWSNPAFGELISTLETGGPIPVTFDAETAYQREAEFIHGRHPIVRAIAEFYGANPESLPLGGYAKVPSASRDGSFLFFVYRITAGGLRASRTLMAVVRHRETGAIDPDAGRELLTYLAGPDPVRLQQRSLPIVGDGEVGAAFEDVQAEVVRHCNVLQEDLQRRNDALLAVRQEALRSGLEIQRSLLSGLANRPDLHEKIRRMRLGQIANLERDTQNKIADLEHHRQVRVGFKVVAGGIADFVPASGVTAGPSGSAMPNKSRS